MESLTDTNTNTNTTKKNKDENETVDTDIPWWTGVPTTLIKKTTLIEASEELNRLPVYTLTFAIPSTSTMSSKGPAMPHASIRIDMGDVVKMVIPNYKPKSYSVSALRLNQQPQQQQQQQQQQQDIHNHNDSPQFDVTFKVYPNGRASGFLDRLRVGDQIHTFGKSSGRVRNPGRYVGIIAFGVGITEGLPVAEAELRKMEQQQQQQQQQNQNEQQQQQKVVLLWASRNMQETFWQERIDRLLQEYSSSSKTRAAVTFELVRILSRESKKQDEDDPCRLHGRIDPDVLRKVFRPDDPQQARFLTVGTKEMMRMADGMLAQIGYDHHQLLPKMKGNGKEKKRKG